MSIVRSAILVLVAFIPQEHRPKALLIAGAALLVLETATGYLRELVTALGG